MASILVVNAGSASLKLSVVEPDEAARQAALDSWLRSYTRALPLLGELPLATAMAFDLGVFCVVVGATSLMLVALAHQSLRRPRVLTEIDTGGGP